MAYRKLNTGGGGNFLKYSDMKVGQVTEGRVLGIRRSTYGDGDKAKPTWSVKLKQADGVEVHLNGSRVLENSGVETLAPGTLLKVTYKGLVKGRGANYHDLDVEIDDGTEGPTQAVASPTAVVAAATPAPASDGPSAVDIAAAKALLARLEAPAASVYETLLAKLKDVNPKGAAAMATALLELHPTDEGARIEKLKKTLVQQGVTL